MQNSQNKTSPVRYANERSENSRPIKITTMRAVPGDRNHTVANATEVCFVSYVTKKPLRG